MYRALGLVGGLLCWVAIAAGSPARNVAPLLSQVPIGATLSLDVPAPSQLFLAEKRDFYVIGSFAPNIQTPGNLQIEVFRGPQPTGERVRLVASSVAQPSGCTSLDDLDFKYANGINYGLGWAPDLIKNPGGLMFPGNKLFVAPTMYVGVVLGGVTKDFDTNYTDEGSNPLTDLTAGAYTILVTGLSGDVAGATAARTFYMGLTHLLLGRFSPTLQYQALEEFAASHYLTLALDPFPGYLWINNQGYEVPSRWRTNNAVEVINWATDTLLDSPDTAANDLVIYNISQWCATQQTEIGALCLHEQTESEGMAWRYWDIGEPELDYCAPDGSWVHLQGCLETFPPGMPLAVVRLETKEDMGFDEENIIQVSDSTPKRLQVGPTMPVIMSVDEKLTVIGTCRPIPSAVTLLDQHYRFLVENRVRNIRYQFLDFDLEVALEEIRDVSVGRVYDPARPQNIAPSIYEFKNDFSASVLGPGFYIVEMSGLDAHGQEVDGAWAGFMLLILPDPVPYINPRADINEDGDVNGADLLLLMRGWHQPIWP